MTSAALSSRQGMSSAMTCSLSTFGACPGTVLRRIRRTVELSIVTTPTAAPPLRTLLTNSVVVEPCVTDVMSHGPWMLFQAIVSTGRPALFSTIRQPYCAVADIPLVVGRLPTTTYPPGRMLSAVVNPTPPGQDPGSFFALIAAKTESLPAGVSSTTVVPVPWLLDLALKLLTR